MSYINTDMINEIRNKTDIVEVISRYLPLVKKGNNYFGVCPFHDDHNPSMSVSPDKQLFKCFVCETGGNVFTFISKYEHISFNEAVALIGKNLGYNISTYSNITKVNNIDYDIYVLANKFYQNNLYSNLGKNAINYLLDREFTKDTVKKFEIGLSVSRMSLTDFLIKKDYSLNKLVDLGLSNTMSNDIFIDRIMVPLHDLNGNVVGFSGRIYQTKDDRKYINSKESNLFKKNALLYNYHRAHQKLKKDDSIIIMEGFFDVIRADCVGVENCVATMGTALTNEHIKILKKITNNIILCFDGDEAGEKATIRAIPLLEEMGISTKIIRLEEKDPDEFIKKRGKDAFISKVNNPISVMDFKMKILKSSKDMSNIEDISKYIDDTLKELVKVDNEIEVELNLKKIEAEYNVDYKILRDKYDGYKNKVNNKKREIVIKKNTKFNQYEQAINNLIYYMLKDEEIIILVEKEIIYIVDDNKRLLFNEIISYYHKYGTFIIADFFSYLSNNDDLIDLLNKIITLNLKDNYTLEEINDYIKVANNKVKDIKIKKLEKQLKDETDQMIQLKILNEIASIKGVNGNVRSN